MKTENVLSKICMGCFFMYFWVVISCSIFVSKKPKNQNFVKPRFFSGQQGDNAWPSGMVVTVVPRTKPREAPWAERLPRCLNILFIRNSQILKVLACQYIEDYYAPKSIQLSSGICRKLSFYICCWVNKERKKES